MRLGERRGTKKPFHGRSKTIINRERMLSRTQLKIKKRGKNNHHQDIPQRKSHGLPQKLNRNAL
jgi:hypothetical protein